MIVGEARQEGQDIPCHLSHTEIWSPSPRSAASDIAHAERCQASVLSVCSARPQSLRDML